MRQSSILYENHCTNCFYSFKPCGILEKMTKKILGHKRIKTRVLMLVLDVTLQRLLGKTY